ncbi:MAG: hypothetical protein ACYTGH_14385, partial [Planctomycetota bacterium]
MSISTSDSPRPKKSLFKRLGCGCLGCFLILAIGVYLFGGSLIHRSLEEIAEKEIGLPVSIGEVRLSIVGRPSITLKNLTLGNESPKLLTIQEINAGLSLDESAVHLVIDQPQVTIAPNAWESGRDLHTLIAKLNQSDDSKSSFSIPFLRVDGAAITFATPNQQGGTVHLHSLTANHLASANHPHSANAPNLEITQLQLKSVDQKASIQVGSASIERRDGRSPILRHLRLDQLQWNDTLLAPGQTASQRLFDSVRLLVDRIIPPAQAPVQSQPAQRWTLEEALLKSIQLTLLQNGAPLLQQNLGELKMENVDLEEGFSIRSDSLALEGWKTIASLPQPQKASLHLALEQGVVKQIQLSPDSLQVQPTCEGLTLSLRTPNGEEEISCRTATTELHMTPQRLTLNNPRTEQLQAQLHIRPREGVILPSEIERFLNRWQALITAPPAPDLPQGQKSAPALGVQIKNLALNHTTLQLLDNQGDTVGLRCNLAVPAVVAKTIDIQPDGIALAGIDLNQASAQTQHGSTPLLSAGIDKLTLPALNLTAGNKAIPGLHLQGSALTAHLGRPTSQPASAAIKNFRIELLPSSAASLLLGACHINGMNKRLTLTSPGVYQEEAAIQELQRQIEMYFGPATPKAPSTPLRSIQAKSLQLTHYQVEIQDRTSPQLPNTLTIGGQEKSLQSLNVLFNPEGGLDRIIADGLLLKGIHTRYTNTAKAGLQLTLDSFSSSRFEYPGSSLGTRSVFLLNQCRLSTVQGAKVTPHAQLDSLMLNAQSLEPLHIAGAEGERLNASLTYHAKTRQWQLEKGLTILEEGLSSFSKPSTTPSPQNTGSSKLLRLDRMLFKDIRADLTALAPTAPSRIQCSLGDLDLKHFDILTVGKDTTLRTKELLLNQLSLKAGRDRHPIHLACKQTHILDVNTSALSRGESTLSFNLSDLLIRKEKVSHDPTRIQFETLKVSLPEVSPRRVVIESLDCKAPRIAAVLNAKQEVDLAAFSDELSAVLQPFSPPESAPSTQPSTTALVLRKITVDGGDLRLVDRF